MKASFEQARGAAPRDVNSGAARHKVGTTRAGFSPGPRIQNTVGDREPAHWRGGSTGAFVGAGDRAVAGATVARAQRPGPTGRRDQVTVIVPVMFGWKAQM